MDKHNHIIDIRDKAKSLDLDHYEILFSIDEESLCNIYNGVGPDWVPRCCRIILSVLNAITLPAVIIHDMEYEIGGTENDFKASNNRLYHNMKKCISADSHIGILQKFIYFTKAWVFAKLCNMFGWIGWEFKNKV